MSLGEPVKCAPIYLVDIEENSHIRQIDSKGGSVRQTLLKASINKVSNLIMITLIAGDPRNEAVGCIHIISKITRITSFINSFVVSYYGGQVKGNCADCIQMSHKDIHRIIY